MKYLFAISVVLLIAALSCDPSGIDPDETCPVIPCEGGHICHEGVCVALAWWPMETGMVKNYRDKEKEGWSELEVRWTTEECVVFEGQAVCHFVNEYIEPERTVKMFDGYCTGWENGSQACCVLEQNGTHPDCCEDLQDCAEPTLQLNDWLVYYRGPIEEGASFSTDSYYSLGMGPFEREGVWSMMDLVVVEADTFEGCAMVVWTDLDQDSRKDLTEWLCRGVGMVKQEYQKRGEGYLRELTSVSVQ